VSDKDFDVRGEIMRSISATDDAKDRSMLMLMLGVLERVEKLLADEETLRQRVLNGDYPRHSEHHELIEELADINAAEAIRWVNQFRDSGVDEVCHYSKTKMQEDIDAKATRKGFKHAALMSLAGELGRVAITAVAAVTGVLWVIK